MTEKSNQFSEKRGFNLPHVFDRNVVVLLVVYAITLVYEMWSLIEYEGFVNFTNFYEGTYNLSQITFVAGFIVSLVQFSFLQVKSKCTTILSFGESRKSLFRKRFWFPLGTLVLMTIGFYIVLLCTDVELKKKFSVFSDEYFANLLMALLPLIFGYTVGALARIISGKTSETIFFGASVCVLPFSIFSFIDSVFALSLRGYYVEVSDYGISNYGSVGGNPITTFFSLFDPLFTLNPNVYGFDNADATILAWYENPVFYIIKSLVWIALTIFIAFFIEKYFVKRFMAENCNKSGKNKMVRITSSVALSLFSCSVISQIVYGGLGADMQAFAMLPFLIVVLIIALIATIVITSVLYRKKVQLPFSFLGVGITATFGIIVYLISVTGCFGYSTYMPETAEIKSVMINDPTGLLHIYSPEYVSSAYEDLYVEMCFKTKEEIEKVKDVHNFIAKDKNYDTTETLTIVYELANGGFVYRTYPYLSNAACEKISTLYETDTIDNYYKTIFNQNSEINSGSSDAAWINWDMKFTLNNSKAALENIYGWNSEYYFYEDYWDEGTSYKTVADADSLVIYSKDNKTTYVTDEQISTKTMEKLKKALYEDYTNLSWQQFVKPEKQFGIISFASCKALKDEEQKYLSDGEYLATSAQLLKENADYLYRFSVTADMVNTIEVLKKAGVYEHFNAKPEISEAHIIDSSKFISWVHSNSESDFNKPIDKNGEYLSSLIYSWYNESGVIRYLDKGCDYINLTYKDYEDIFYYDWYHIDIDYKPISESDIEKITPEEAEKLREKAFMTYNAGNDCKLLVMKYTDGTANMLVIPE